MNASPKLNLYLVKIYSKNFLMFFLLLASIIYLFDTIELFRRAGKVGDVPMDTILMMGLYKLPELLDIIFPFSVLFSAMYTFWTLTQRQELVVIRGAGLSVWQFTAPVLAVAFAIGILNMSVLNPFGSVFMSRFEVWENETLEQEKDIVSLLKDGLWLNQAMPDKDGYFILYAEKVALPAWSLNNVMGLRFDNNNNLVQRVDSASANIIPNPDGAGSLWVFGESHILGADNEARFADKLVLPTNFTTKDIEDSLVDPSALSFWQLPSYIKTLEESGFNPILLSMQFQSLLSQPLFLASMVLLAALSCLSLPRNNAAIYLIVSGIIMGFVVFFMANVLQTLGGAQKIPVFMAAWAPGVICTMIGVSAILHVEDG